MYIFCTSKIAKCCYFEVFSIRSFAVMQGFMSHERWSIRKHISGFRDQSLDPIPMKNGC
jgi:hypothetical protein